jgi:hypothetical protein
MGVAPTMTMPLMLLSLQYWLAYLIDGMNGQWIEMEAEDTQLKERVTALQEKLLRDFTVAIAHYLSTTFCALVNDTRYVHDCGCGRFVVNEGTTTIA